MTINENELIYKKFIVNFNDFPKNANIILGLVKQIYARQWAIEWMKNDNKPVIIITIENEVKSGLLENDIYICSSQAFYNLSERKMQLFKFFSRIEIRLSLILSSKKYSILGRFGNQTAVGSVYTTMLVLPLINKLYPANILAHQVLRFGFISQIYNKCSVYIFPYGQDIFIYGKASFFLKNIIKYNLKKAKAIFPASIEAKTFMKYYYKVSSDNIIVFSTIPNLDIFYDKNEFDIKTIRQKYNINSDEFIIINIRRFQNGWGADILTDVFLKLAEHNSNFKIILITGGIETGGNNHLNRIRNSQHKNSFIIFNSSVTIEEYRDLLVMSDLGVSTVLNGDMRSWSVMQAAAVGLPLVMNKTKEYINLQNDGFDAFFLDKISNNDLYEMIIRLSKNSNKLMCSGQNNLLFIENFKTKNNFNFVFDFIKNSN